MQSSKIKQSIFVITGMHRSGTSLTASLFKSMGVDLGQRLMEPGPGNIKGYFEDLDLVEFHRTILRSQCIDDSGWTLQEKIDVEEQYVEKAKEIISKKSLNSIWGWKDPRTTLFLDFWAELLPDANFVLMFRSPWEVVDSLYRRGNSSDEIFLNHPILAVKLWIHYNQKVLDFYNKFPNRSLLISVYRVAQQTQSFVNVVNEKFQVDLVTSAVDVYEQSLLHIEGSSGQRPTLVSHYFPEALDIYKELSQREVRLDEGSDWSWIERIKSSPYRVWAFQDWVDIRSLKRQSESQKAELERAQSQQYQTQAELERAQSQQYQTQAELERAQSQQYQTQAELERAQSQQYQTQAELERAQSQQYQTQAELERAQSQQYQTQAELERVQSQQYQTQAELERVQVQLQQALTELEQSQFKTRHTLIELERSQSQLQQTQTELEESNLKLQKLQIKLQQTQDEITAMQTSKFWKLRIQWFKLKRFVALLPGLSNRYEYENEGRHS